MTYIVSRYCETHARDGGTHASGRSPLTAAQAAGDEGLWKQRESTRSSFLAPRIGGGKDFQLPVLWGRDRLELRQGLPSVEIDTPGLC